MFEILNLEFNSVLLDQNTVEYCIYNTNEERNFQTIFQ